MTMMYKKMTRLSNYLIKSEEVGKMLNMLSNDFGVVEMRVSLFFAGQIFPVVVVGAIVLIYFRIGWQGIVGIGAILILFPLQFMIARYNGHLLEKVNVHKDKRIKVCTETIEGIKSVKLYGW